MGDSFIGLAGGFIFFSSWIVQFYETKRAKKPVYSRKFVWLRIVGSSFLAIEAIRISSITFFLTNLAAGIMMIYVLTKMKNKSNNYY